VPSSRQLWSAAIAVATLLSLAMVFVGLRLDPDVAALLPERGEAAALRRYLRAFGGSDLAMVLISASEDDTPVGDVAGDLAVALEASPSVRRATAGIDTTRALDPWALWRHASPSARAALAEALTPEGMRRRLRGSRDLLLAPGAAQASERIAADPLRLSQLVAEGRIGGGFRAQADGTFASDDGRHRLVLVFPEGEALRGADAKAFVAAADSVLAEFRERHPQLTFGLTGGHAIGAATERMLRRDLQLSSTLSLVLASLLFLLTFRRLRALAAVMPPLLLGSLWTAALASSLPGGLSAIAVAFMSVVIGVGVDTGVHVYAALLEARQDGLSPEDAALRARARTQRPVMVAAGTAAAAFAALGLSEIGALRQLGLLCAAGELLTAVAIVAITPEIGARLERGAVPSEPKAGWLDAVRALTATRARAAIALLLLLAPVGLLIAGMGPAISETIVALRPRGLEPLAVQQRIYDTMGGRAGQWVMMVTDRDRDRARERTDRIVEALSPASPTQTGHLDALDTITTVAPTAATQRARLDERKALDLPARASDLEAALVDVGFAPERFAGVLDGMRSPPTRLVSLEDVAQSPDAILLERYLGKDGDETIVVSYLLPTAGHEADVERAVAAADPAAMLTGYQRLESTLRATLATDLPRIGGVASLLVVIALGFALRRLRDVGLAVAVVAVEIALVLVVVRVVGVPLHAYDALVLPVLLGITVDEAMFLLYRAREATGDIDAVIDETLRREGPPVAATALTTAAGFGGLLICDFDGLAHLGAVGVIGSVAGLVVALIVVPAGLRLLPR
jgi:uncharacterized protein